MYCLGPGPGRKRICSPLFLLKIIVQIVTNIMSITYNGGGDQMLYCSTSNGLVILIMLLSDTSLWRTKDKGWHLLTINAQQSLEQLMLERLLKANLPSRSPPPIRTCAEDLRLTFAWVCSHVARLCFLWLHRPNQLATSPPPSTSSKSLDRPSIRSPWLRRIAWSRLECRIVEQAWQCNGSRGLL